MVHLLAIAGRVGIDLSLNDFELGSDVPLLVNCMPSGQYLMEDFCYAGGMPVVLKELGEMLRPARTVLGGDIGVYADGAECWNEDVIRPMSNPLKPAAGLRVLRGNLAPQGAIIKPSAATESLLEHEAEAYVFESIEDFKANIDREDLPVTKDTILVLKGCGPKGYPGMPEVGNMPIPARLVKEGVRDMVRLSDARMSGTAYGTVVLHISPEAQAGGTLALVKTGDRIRLSAREGSLELLVDETELETRRAAWAPDPAHYTRGYAKMYVDHVLQADQGADLDFLVGKDTPLFFFFFRPVTREPPCLICPQPRFTILKILPFLSPAAARALVPRLPKGLSNRAQRSPLSSVRMPAGFAMTCRTNTGCGRFSSLATSPMSAPCNRPFQPPPKPTAR